MDWRGSELNRIPKEIKEALSEQLIPRLFAIAAQSNVVLNSNAFQQKGLGLNIDLAERSWALYQLLSPASRNLVASLPTSLRRLTHTTVARANEDTSGAVRGQLNVPRTVFERAQKGGNPLFVAFDDSVPTSDVPENQLLRLTLDKMLRDIESAQAFKSQSGLGRELDGISNAVLPALRHPYLQSLRASPAATSQMLQAASRSKIPAHYYAYQFWLQELKHRAGNVEALLEVLSAAFIYPENEDDLFEFFILTKVLLALISSRQWTQVSIGLPTERAIARFRHEALTCTVYANTSPSEAFSWASRYRWKYNRVFELYDGIGYRTRRPDILVEFTPASGLPVPLIIETKLTEDPSYIRDSIYKTLGYLADFEQLWSGQEQFTPKAILALAGGTGPAEGSDWHSAAFQSPVAILTQSGGGMDALVDILTSVLRRFDGLHDQQ